MDGSAEGSSMMTEDLEKALTTPVDYSEAFDAEVDRLKNLLASRTNYQYDIDKDMNYNVCQKICCLLAPDGACVAENDPGPAYQVLLLISSKGRYFTSLILE